MKITITRLALAACGLLLAGCAAQAPRSTAMPATPPAAGMIDATPAFRGLIDFDRQCRRVFGPICHGGGAGTVVKIEGVGPGELAEALAGITLLRDRMECAQRCDERYPVGISRDDPGYSQCLRGCGVFLVAP